MIEIIEPAKEKPPGTMGVRVRIEGYNPCPIHYPTPCDCPKECTGIIEKGDITLLQFAQVCLLNLFATNETIKDTSAASNAETANTASGTVRIVAGTGTTPAAYNDFALQTAVDSPATGTMSAATGSGVSSHFTISGTVTAGASRNYTEVGLQVTINAHVYLLCHDVFTAVPVSSSGTLSVIYTLTYG